MAVTRNVASSVGNDKSFGATGWAAAPSVLTQLVGLLYLEDLTITSRGRGRYEETTKAEQKKGSKKAEIKGEKGG